MAIFKSMLLKLLEQHYQIYVVLFYYGLIIIITGISDLRWRQLERSWFNPFWLLCRGMQLLCLNGQQLAVHLFWLAQHRKTQVLFVFVSFPLVFVQFLPANNDVNLLQKSSKMSPPVLDLVIISRENRLWMKNTAIITSSLTVRRLIYLGKTWDIVSLGIIDESIMNHFTSKKQLYSGDGDKWKGVA